MLRARQPPPEGSASNRNNNDNRNGGQFAHTGPASRPPNLLPFMEAIMHALMSEKPPPTLERYDGSADPDNHLRNFTNAMAFYIYSDLVKCKAFSLSLRDEALEWYHTLPPNTVDSFATVTTLFRRQYAAKRRQEMTLAELVNTKQEKDETLKAFMQRYNEIARQVKDANHTFVINNLPKYLKPGYVAEQLYVEPPKTMEELKERMAKFIRMEDLRNSRRKQQQEAPTNGSKKKAK